MNKISRIYSTIATLMFGVIGSIVLSNYLLQKRRLAAKRKGLMLESHVDRAQSALWTMFKQRAVALLKEARPGEFVSEDSCTAYSRIVFEFLRMINKTPRYSQVIAIAYEKGYKGESAAMALHNDGDKHRAAQQEQRKQNSSTQNIHWNGHLVVVCDGMLIDTTFKRRDLGNGYVMPDAIYNEFPQVIVAQCDLPNPLAVYFENTMIYYEFDNGREYECSPDFTAPRTDYRAIARQIIDSVHPNWLIELNNGLLNRGILGEPFEVPDEAFSRETDQELWKDCGL